MTYKRPPGAVAQDFLNAREFEQEVADILADEGHRVHTRFDGKDELDVWVPGWYVEIKEKRQRFGERWHLLDGVPQENLMILDELGIRRMVRHWPHVYLLIRDVPEDRLFLAGIWEVIALNKVRVDRETKGKWILDMSQFRQIQHVQEIGRIANQELPTMPWKQPNCTGEGIPQV